MQRELSLDQVQVVRSDLRDEDLVVVMARPRDGAGGGGASSPKWGVVGRAWERLSSRFTTVNQT
ncbi:MAG: hypothetical protein N3I86_05270 [Verrucomicrobiae bacterium]|nr:hypothetical protein [Verrucomicrobiae bacterium]MDW8308986.1 hypothetical protein [Verrucomicrobiales bacterium]